MKIQTLSRAAILAATCFALSGLAGLTHADESVADAPVSLATTATVESSSFFNRANNLVQDTLSEALNLIGVPYRRGGNNPQSGFDCSGYVRHVFEKGMGLVLPHNAKAMSKQGEQIDKQELEPGDLVFFNTMRRAFSHVGIYLGNGQFVHSPRSGAQVRVESMQDSYWKKRYNGARRVAD
jgi:cell wall-associated NlpC family hydrolase